jgi:hypothetical protein
MTDSSNSVSAQAGGNQADKRREIKFRAWDEKRKSFVVDGFVIYPDGKTEFPEGGWDLHGYDDGLLLMQYTGLTDKNGVEIYEGDLLRNTGEVWEVVFSSGEFKLICKSERGGNEIASMARFKKVIGNIYQNPELLEAQS